MEGSSQRQQAAGPSSPSWKDLTTTVLGPAPPRPPQAQDSGASSRNWLHQVASKRVCSHGSESGHGQEGSGCDPDSLEVCWDGPWGLWAQTTGPGAWESDKNHPRLFLPESAQD